MHIGFDDTDSLEGSCTTFVALKMIERLSNYVEFTDYPRLIRNNPNIPWKTRGNGAIAISILVDENKVDTVVSDALDIIENMYKIDENTNPGLVVLKGDIPDKLQNFMINALTEVIPISKAKELAEEVCYKYYTIGNGRGLIGGLAAIANLLSPKNEDFTFELLTYRKYEKIGTKRKLDLESLILADNKFKPSVFNNIDEESKKAVIAPAGPDPVFYGIRGENPGILLQMMKDIKIAENLDSYCIFRTNQGTDQHFKYAKSDIKDHNVFKGKINITAKPKIIQGGHIIVEGKIENAAETVDVVAYEPTKDFRNKIKRLLPGDILIAYGGISYKEKFHKFSLQLEKCEIIFLSEQFKQESPFCPSCNTRMTSNGFNKGYKCRKCGYKNKDASHLRVKVEREISKGLYIPPAQAQRHLVKPYRRYNLPNKTSFELINEWWKIID